MAYTENISPLLPLCLVHPLSCLLLIVKTALSLKQTVIRLILTVRSPRLCLCSLKKKGNIPRFNFAKINTVRELQIYILI